jgi:hypothetical protein
MRSGGSNPSLSAIYFLANTAYKLGMSKPHDVFEVMIELLEEISAKLSRIEEKLPEHLPIDPAKFGILMEDVDPIRELVERPK